MKKVFKGYIFEDGTIAWVQGFSKLELKKEKQQHGELLKIITEQQFDEYLQQKQRLNSIVE